MAKKDCRGFEIALREHDVSRTRCPEPGATWCCICAPSNKPPGFGLQLGLARSTVSAVLAREGFGARAALEPPRPPNRYERRQAGELLHLDIKKLGRFRKPGHRVTGSRARKTSYPGWEFVHVAIDDFSRVAYAEVLADETGQTCARFMRRACAWFACQGIWSTLSHQR